MIALIVMTVFFVWTVGTGLYARRKKRMDLENWAVGGRNFNTIFIFLLTAGEVYTTFSFLGGSGFAYLNGVSATYVMIYIALSYVTSYFLLPCIWRYAKKHQLISQSDFFVKKYESKWIGIIVAVIGVIATVPIIVIQLKGLGIIVSLTSYGYISMSGAVIIGAFAMVLYTVVSGIRGIAWVAIVKDSIILSVIVFMGIYLPYHYYGGFANMFHEIEKVKPSLLVFAGQGYTVTWFISTVLFYVFGFYMWPQVFASTFTAKNEKTFRKNAVISPIYTLMLLFVIIIGLAAVIKIPGLKGAESDLALLKLALLSFDPWFIGVIGAAGVLTAIVPGSMLLMTSATLIAKNIIFGFKNAPKENHIAQLAKIFVPILSVIACFFVFVSGNFLAALLQMGYSFIVQLCPSLFASLFKKNFITKQGAISGMIAGLLCAIFVTKTNMTIASLLPFLPGYLHDINSGFLPLLLNIFVMITVSLLTKKASS